MCWVFVDTWAFLELWRAGATLYLRYTGFVLRGLLLLQSMGSGARASVFVSRELSGVGSVVVAHGLSCTVACGIFPDQ